MDIVKTFFYLLRKQWLFLLIGAALVAVGGFVPAYVKQDDGSSLRYGLLGVGAFFIFLVFAIGFFGAIFVVRKQKRVLDVMENGERGKALVLEIEDTGLRINRGMRVKLLLEMHFENYEPYEALKKITLPEVNIAQVQPGQEVTVYADPDDPQNTDKLAIELK